MMESLQPKQSVARPVVFTEGAQWLRTDFHLHTFVFSLAEAQGFEPWNPCGLPVFKTGAIDHSAKLPADYLQQISTRLGWATHPCLRGRGF